MKNVNQKFLEEFADVLEEEKESLKLDYELNKENFDSLALVATVALIDEHYEVNISGNELRNVHTLGRLLELIEKAKGA